MLPGDCGRRALGQPRPRPQVAPGGRGPADAMLNRPDPDGLVPLPGLRERLRPGRGAAQGVRPPPQRERKPVRADLYGERFQPTGPGPRRAAAVPGRVPVPLVGQPAKSARTVPHRHPRRRGPRLHRLGRVRSARRDGRVRSRPLELRGPRVLPLPGRAEAVGLARRLGAALRASAVLVLGRRGGTQLPRPDRGRPGAPRRRVRDDPRRARGTFRSAAVLQGRGPTPGPRRVVLPGLQGPAARPLQGARPPPHPPGRAARDRRRGAPLAAHTPPGLSQFPGAAGPDRAGCCS